MSDDISPEVIAAAGQRDARIRLIGEAIAIEAELRDSPTIRALMGRVRSDADAALIEMADLSPVDTDAVAKCIVKARTLVYIRASLDSILRRAGSAAQEIQAEDHVGLDERDD